MELFFDSGATKCDAILLDGDGRYVRHCTDIGINATYMRDDEMAQVLERLREQTGTDGIDRITFSGAGCGNPDNAVRVESLLKKQYPSARTEVISDLLGACRLLSSGETALVAILGTGASACLYDGSRIVAQAPSLGYLLGDEGSGTYLGKALIQKYLRNEVPPPLESKIEQAYGIDKRETLRRIYREPAPNRFLASFARFLGDNRQDAFVNALLKEAFTDFLHSQIFPIRPYNIYMLNLMGSVGFHFREIIGEVAGEFDITIGKATASPLQSLRTK
jgi:N-acetylglucosamine kinase-like BadF-type ATPase